MGSYYNENDPKICAWLRELIREGVIADGEVDERSIKEVHADDLKGFTQHHFFAGIGGWSYALRLADWPDDRPVWTGSCPCPPFSSAGKKFDCPECGERNLIPCPRRTGYFICCLCRHSWLADERHLWPEFWRLIRDYQPGTVFGEQVASKDGRKWLSGVRASLEILGYAVGAADLCAAGTATQTKDNIGSALAESIREQHGEITEDLFREWWVESGLSEGNGIGSPQIRQRLWWVADADSGMHNGGVLQRPQEGFGENSKGTPNQLERSGSDGRLSNAPISQSRALNGQFRSGAQSQVTAGGHDISGGLLNTEPGGRRAGSTIEEAQASEEQPDTGHFTSQRHNPWDEYDVLEFADGKARRVEPGTFPLAHGVPARILRLCGYGNAINPQTAALFIRAVIGDMKG